MLIFLKAMVIQNNVVQAHEIPDEDVDELSSVISVGVMNRQSNTDSIQQLGIATVDSRNEEHRRNSLFSDTSRQLNGDRHIFNEFEPQIEIVGNCMSSLQPDDQSSVEKMPVVVNDCDAEHRDAEISAAILSLKTNLVLGLTFICVFVSMSVTPDYIVSLIASVLKGVTSIITGIANFGKLQIIVRLYFESAVGWIRKK